MKEIDIKDTGGNVECVQIHFKYVVCILTGVIILLACNFWTDRPNFTEYLTNVATFVSLVLGLVAIVYSFISNASLSASLGNITKVSDEVSLTKVEIQKYLISSTEISRASEQNADLLRDVSAQLQDNVLILNTALDDINHKTEVLQEAVSSIPEKLDHIQNSVEKSVAMSPLNTPQATVETVDSASINKFHNSFLELTSIYGLFLIYTYKLSFTKNKPFKLKEVMDHIDLTDIDYFRGFRVALIAGQMVSLNDSDEPLTVVQFLCQAIKDTDMNTSLTDSIQRVFDEPDEIDTRFIWLAKVEKLEKYFE